MREGIEIELTAKDRARLEAVVADRNSPQKHVWRARIVLATADGHGTAEVMRRAGKSKPCVRRWQERFISEGVAGLLRDKTRPPRIPPLAQAMIDRVVELTATEPPGEATHWTAAAMAAAVGISPSSVLRIWRAHKLRPHRVRAFSPRTRRSPPSCGTSSGSTWTRRRTRSCSRWTRSRKSRRPTAPSRDCR